MTLTTLTSCNRRERPARPPFCRHSRGRKAPPRCSRPACRTASPAYATMGALPGKKPLIQLAYRPPNYETPLEYLRTPITPNDAFFVRYHLADIPEVDAKTWKLTSAATAPTAQVELTLDELKKMPAVEVVAVNQCSGNRRGLFEAARRRRRMGLRRHGLRALERRAAQGRARQGRR